MSAPFPRRLVVALLTVLFVGLPALVPLALGGLSQPAFASPPPHAGNGSDKAAPKGDGSGVETTTAAKSPSNKNANNPQQKAPGQSNKQAKAGSSSGNSSQGNNNKASGNSNKPSGNSASAPGNSNAPGNSAKGNSASGPSNKAKGNSPGNAPGNKGNNQGNNQGNSPGNAPGNSGNAPGHSANPPGNAPAQPPGHAVAEEAHRHGAQSERAEVQARHGVAEALLRTQERHERSEDGLQIGEVTDQSVGRPRERMTDEPLLSTRGRLIRAHPVRPGPESILISTRVCGCRLSNLPTSYASVRPSGGAGPRCSRGGEHR
jgi:hypothetical protein